MMQVEEEGVGEIPWGDKNERNGGDFYQHGKMGQTKMFGKGEIFTPSI